MNSRPTNFRLEDFIVDSPIGQGAYGQIYKAVEQSTGTIYALKALNRRFLMKVKKQNLPIIEKNAMMACKSDFVIPLYGTFKDDSNLYFVLEYANHGDLAEAINDIGSLNIDVVKLISAQLLKALCACHTNKVIHRDIKPENVLLNSKNHVRLSDFGTALINKEETPQLQRSSIVGTPAFVAPELLNDGQICYSSDMWSYACVIFNMLTGSLPFEGENPAELMKNITALKFSPDAEKLPKTAKDLIMKLLVIIPSQRLGFDEFDKNYPSIQNHPFFKGVDWDHLTTVNMPIFSKFLEDVPPSIADDKLELGEKVLLQSEMLHKRKLRWRDRTLILTSGKRILLFNPKKGNVFKHEIVLTQKTNIVLYPNGKDFAVVCDKVQNLFRTKNRDDSTLWGSSLMREIKNIS